MIKKASIVVALFLATTFAIIAIPTFGGTQSDTIDKAIVEATTESKIEAVELESTIESKPEEVSAPKIEKTVSNVNSATEDTTSKNEQVSSQEKTDYASDDLFNLAVAICREAGGESDEIQLLVANVVVNRVNSSVYPNTIYAVLTQPHQYGTMWKYGISFPDWADESTKAHCYEIAKRILDGERVCPENVLFQAEFIQGSGVYKEINGFYFCYYG